MTKTSGEKEGDSKSELLRDHKQALSEWKEKHFRDVPKIGEELDTPIHSPAPAGSDSGLVERLLRQVSNGSADAELVNPDGPEAAAIRKEVQLPTKSTP